MVTHTKLVAQIEGDPPRPTDVEVLIENENVGDTQNTLDICMLVMTYDVEWHEKWYML
jgi:hypothetical protein